MIIPVNYANVYLIPCANKSVSNFSINLLTNIQPSTWRAALLVVLCLCCDLFLTHSHLIENNNNMPVHFCCKSSIEAHVTYDRSIVFCSGRSDTALQFTLVERIKMKIIVLKPTKMLQVTSASKTWDVTPSAWRAELISCICSDRHVHGIEAWNWLAETHPV